MFSTTLVPFPVLYGALEHNFSARQAVNEVIGSWNTYHSTK